jgi:hypothetical protein
MEVHGRQEGGNYNGHYRKTAYHPLVASFSIVELGWHHVDTWRHAQRVILVVMDRPDPLTGQVELIPDYFFLVTNWLERQRSATNLLAHYRNRGTLEDRLGEFKQAVGVHLSSQPFAKNEATMLLAMLAYNLASIARNELEAAEGGCWDLRRFQSFVLQAAARITKHSRRLMVRVALSVQGFWAQLAGCISRWRLPDHLRPTRGPRPRMWRPPPAHAHQQEVLRS